MLVWHHPRVGTLPPHVRERPGSRLAARGQLCSCSWSPAAGSGLADECMVVQGVIDAEEMLMVWPLAGL